MSRKGNQCESIVGLPLGDRVKSILKTAYRARRPFLLEGDSGIGKSELVSQLAAEMGIGCIVLDLSLLEPPDLIGLPVISGGRTRFAVPSQLPTEGAGFLFLEELNRAERHIQQPSLQLLSAKRLNEYVLPPDWVPCERSIQNQAIIKLSRSTRRYAADS